MAFVDMYFPKNAYPEDYNPPIAGFNYNPSLEELLVDLEKIRFLSSTTSTWSGEMSNGLQLKLTGKAFSFNDEGSAVSGKLTEIRLIQNDGKTSIQRVTQLNLPLKDVFDQFHKMSGAEFNLWLMRGNDKVLGTPGADILIGGAGNDVLTGASGDDYFWGGPGRDTYIGGKGSEDQLSFSDAYDDPTAFRGVDLNAYLGIVTDAWGNRETFSSMEIFRGTQFDDKMFGGTGDEIFRGLGGADSINGGLGRDLVRYDRDAGFGGERGVIVNLLTGLAVDGFGNKDTLRNIESVEATRFDDTITGNAAANRIDLGLGKDTYIFASRINGINVDSIPDFKPADDIFHLDIDFFLGVDAGKLNRNDFKVIAIGQPINNIDGSDRILYDKRRGEIYFDRDGSGDEYGRVYFAEVKGNTALTSDDFLFVV